LGNARLCRFCGSADTITVSAWPEWATRLIAVQMAARYSLRAVENVKAQILEALPEDLREDFIASRKLQVACKRCLHGWMSRLDAQVRPLLVPLVTGKELNLTPAAQRSLAAWIAKTIMIAEFASGDGVITPRVERETLRVTMEPPKSWNIWVARSSGRNWVARYVRHTAGLGATDTKKGIQKDTQSITLGMGRIIVHVMASNVPGMKFELPSKADSFHFLWPARKAISWPPRGALDHDEAEDFSLAFNRDFGTPEMEHIAAAS
jgi:hypothetical protein